MHWIAILNRVYYFILIIMKNFNFNIEKATQTAAYLLKLNGGAMNYTILLKMLYLADRASFDLYGKPIIGDMYCAMKYGPVLSTVLDLMTDPVDEKNKCYWYEFLKTDNYNLILQNDPTRS